MLKVGIIGLGLIGGSIAKALKKRVNAYICAFNRSEKSLIEAYNDKIIDTYSISDISIFNECDIIFICTPVDKIEYYVKELSPYIKKECIITDVGSTKKGIYEKMLKYENICFIGGHPMAGSEKTSYNSSIEYLFENAYYIITPTPNIQKNITDKFVNIIKIMGAIPIIISSQYHDYIVAAISHVPHVISSALVNMVQNLDGDDKYMHTLAAGGFKDITRIASSSPEMWNSICNENKDEILKIIDNFISILNSFKNDLKESENENIFNFFSSAKTYRDTFTNKSSYAYLKTYDILLDVIDRPGIIATISTMLSVNNINIKNIGIINSREYENGILQIILDKEEDKNKSLKLLQEMNFNVYTK